MSYVPLPYTTLSDLMWLVGNSVNADGSYNMANAGAQNEYDAYVQYLKSKNMYTMDNLFTGSNFGDFLKYDVGLSPVNMIVPDNTLSYNAATNTFTSNTIIHTVNSDPTYTLPSGNTITTTSTPTITPTTIAPANSTVFTGKPQLTQPQLLLISGGAILLLILINK